MKFLLLLLLVTLSGAEERLSAPSIACRDESGSPVDWWVIMKVPLLRDSSDPDAASGYGYAYADARNTAFDGPTNKRLDTNTHGALASTLNQIYTADASSVGWLLYNDQTPDQKEHSSYGHTKGGMGFDANGGFWLVHSVPRFPEPTGNGTLYSFPSNGQNNGQSFICMSYDLANINEAAGGFLLNKPYVYDSSLPSQLETSLPNVVAVLQKKFLTESASKVSSLRTRGGTPFMSFSKNAKFDNDLWSQLVSPSFKSDLLVETWMNGALTNKMPSFCKPTYLFNNININQVSLGPDVTWPETKDHSKWAIATSGAPIFCIGDNNRQYSQEKRGGGAVCGQNPQMWTALKSMVTGVDSC